jgi:hypothetical protein
MELRNIILELGIDKDGDTVCKEIRNNTVEVESSWYSYRALDYSDTYENKHDDTITTLHIAYDDARDMVLHMKVKDKNSEYIMVYGAEGAEKELFILSDRISIKYNEFFKSTMKRGKESVKKDIKNIESDISALQKEISDLVAEMTKLSEVL